MGYEAKEDPEGDCEGEAEDGGPAGAVFVGCPAYEGGEEAGDKDSEEDCEVLVCCFWE